MKKKYYPIISITLVAVVLVSVLLFFQINTSGKIETSKNLALIDYSTTYATVSTVYQRKTFLFNGTYWLFYGNGTGLFYTSSPDGSNWRAPITITDGPSASAMSVWNENGIVHYANAAGSSPIVYMRGEIIGNEIHWNEQKNVVLGVPTYEYYNAYCTVDSNGLPWVSFMRYDNGSPENPWSVQVARANSPGGEHWSAMQISDNSSLPIRPCLVPLPETRMYAILATQNGVAGTLWNGTGWQPLEQISSRHLVNDYDYSAVSLNAEVQLTVLENNTGNVYNYRRLANGEWQENLLIDQQDSIAAVLSVDSSRKILYCTWLQGNTLQLKKMENGNWADITIDNIVISSPVALSVFFEVNDGKLGVALLDALPERQSYKLHYFVIENL